jgi:hypothetical protein
VILGRDSEFDADVIAFLKSTGLKPKRTSVRAPWQNRMNEAHLRRLIRDYVTITMKVVFTTRSKRTRRTSVPHLCGLHRRYSWQQASYDPAAAVGWIAEIEDTGRKMPPEDAVAGI